MTEIQFQAQQAKKALQRAVAKALEQKRRMGQYAVISRNGKPVRIEPEQLPELWRNLVGPDGLFQGK